ncbi:MAG: D-alanyl-D-alanine carboxypeptidase [Candidatus Roizmanbacteria bacterium]|nr:MAG: D-alanyl-D-alanine carboxypeptidase [Candidatus Roizmanbacteria bacterium]
MIILNFKFQNSKLKIAALILLILILNLFNPTPLPGNVGTYSYVEKNNSFDQVKLRLHQIPNTYKLKTDSAILSSVYAESYDGASAYAVVDLDSGEVLFEKSLSQRLPVASLTKIMTAITSLDLSSPDEVFTATDRVALVIPTRIGITPGQKLSLEELLHAGLLTSANDAMEVIKDGIDAKYGKGTFVAAMNEKAKFIGLKNTHFDNPQGFDSLKNYSTVEDLAVLSHYALMNYPIINSITRKNYQFLPPNQNHPQFDLYNWNGLVGVYPNTIGLKIGNTNDAGMTSVVVSERGGKRLLVIVLGAPDVTKRDLWAAELLDMGYSKVLGLPQVAVTEEQLQQKYSTWKFWG